jgi:hypothetical protein
MIEVGLLQVDGAIFHQIPEKHELAPDGSAAQPIRSTIESPLDDELEFFLRNRLARTFGEAAQPVRREADSASPTPDMVSDALAGPTPDIVVPFHPLADLLHDVQAHNSPSGLLTVVRGSCGATPILAIAKIEEERGLSFSTEIDGEDVRVEVAIQDGLVLTDKTEVFKAAIFYLQDENLVGLVTDDQAGSAYNRPTSNYWLHDFLGCEYSNDVDVATRDWIKATKHFARSDLKDDPQKQSDVLTAMHTELRSNRTTIDPKRFIENHVPLDRQDRALERLRTNGVPNRRFPKSESVAASAPPKRKYIFDSGYEVRVPADQAPQIHSEEIEGETISTLTVRGRLLRVES